jgi:hypothetical protein
MSGALNRGAPRPYHEALTFGVIDARVREPVAAFNVEGVIGTTASCEGHGVFSCRLSPYVAFKTDSRLAAALHVLLERDAHAPHPRLYHYWTITARFNEHGALSYCLCVPGIDRYWRFGRARLDRDFLVIASMLKALAREVCCAVAGSHGEPATVDLMEACA